MTEPGRKTLDRGECGWVIARVWLNALEETARDFHGTRPRTFVTRAYEHATEEWLRVLEQDYGLKPREAATMKEAVESYIDIGVKAGLFVDASQFNLEEKDPYRLDVSVLVCPYRESCKDLLDRGFSLRNLTCARMGCFRAAVQALTNISCDYEVTSVKPEEGCTGLIHMV
jgi:hypothetical protein